MKHSTTLHTLDKASQLLVVKTPGAESTYLSISIKGGFRSVPKSEHHVPHLLEHMIFEGSNNYPTSQAVAEAIERNGGYFNATTTEEYLNFEFYVAREDVDDILPVAVDCIYHPLLTQKSLEEERQVITNEVGEHMADYAGVLEHYTQAAILPDLYPNFEEQLEDLTRINHSQVQSYHKQYFTAANSFFVIAGDIDTKVTHQIISKLNTLLADVQTGELISLQTFAIDNVGPALAEVEVPKSTNAGFSLAFVSSDTSDQGIATRKVIDSLLLSGATSRLQNKVRKAGLAYGVNGGETTILEGGMFSVSGPCERSNIDKLFSVVVQELRSLAEGFVSQSEIDRSKGNVIGGLKRGIESPIDLAKWYEYELIIGQGVTSPLERIDNINRVSVKDVITMAADLFQRDNMVGSVIGYKIKKKYNEIVFYSEAAFNSTMNSERRVSSAANDVTDIIPGQLVSKTATVGSFSYRLGEIWLTDEGILRLPMALKEMITNSTETYPRFTGVSPAGTIKRTALTDPKNVFIDRKNLASYKFYKGVVNGRLRLILNDGRKYKFLFLKNDMDYELVKHTLDAWINGLD